MVIREVQSGGSCKPEQYIICLLFGNNGVVIRIILYVGGRSWHRTSGVYLPKATFRWILAGPIDTDSYVSGRTK